MACGMSDLDQLAWTQICPRTNLSGRSPRSKERRNVQASGIFVRVDDTLRDGKDRAQPDQKLIHITLSKELDQVFDLSLMKLCLFKHLHL